MMQIPLYSYLCPKKYLHILLIALFVHLNCHSSYSLLSGIPSVKELAKAAAKAGMPALAITDTHNMFGAVWTTCNLPDEGVQPILGSQVLITVDKNEHGEALSGIVTLLVQNEQGWRNLIKISTQASFASEELGTPQVNLAFLRKHSAGLICLTGGAKFGVLGVLLFLKENGVKKAEKMVSQLQDIFGDRLYMDIQRHGFWEEKYAENFFLDWADEKNIPLVATNDCRFLDKAQYVGYEAMLCIDQGMTTSNPDKPTLSDEYDFKSAQEMCALFSDLPEAIHNTLVIAKRCAFHVPLGTYYMPDWQREEGDNRTMDQIMIDQAQEGLADYLPRYVYPKNASDDEKENLKKEYQERLEYEISIITKMGYAGYFLITSDFIRWSKDHGIPVGPGRGSGAGSLVAWCMKITDVNPIPYDLYFERFLNPERVSMPDFDIDFCVEGRMAVVDYVRRKYGDECVAQIVTFGTLLAKGCIRDVGRVMEMPFPVVNRIAGFIPDDPGKKFTINGVMDDDERLAELYESDEEVKRVLDVAMKIEGAHRHTSVHPAGVIIAGEPIPEICPLWKDSRADMPATQFDMIAGEMAGLVKFDFLGLKNLTVINRAVKMIKKNHGMSIDILTIPMDDKVTFEMLRNGHTVGVFQVESKGMTDFLVRMEPDKFSYLSDVIALYRPGPLESGMTDDFIECRHGRQEPKYPHEALKPVLEETFGVPVYQEQVMRMAQVMAGYSLGGADMLRRAMGKKKVSEMDKQRQIFAQGAEKIHGLKREDSDKIFDLMANFAGYGFNKAHTIAYGLVSYQTAYLKAHFPLEFLAASMTMDRGVSDKILKFKRELERLNVPLHGPDVNKSCCDFRVENGGVRFALTAIKGAGEEAMERVQKEREQHGDYQDIFDFIERLGPEVVNKKQLEVLIKAGAFDAMYSERGYLFRNIHILLSHCQTFHQEKNSNQMGLFAAAGDVQVARPVLSEGSPWDPFEKLEKEQQVIGFYLSSHPLNVYDNELRAMSGIKDVATLDDLAIGGITQARIACLVHDIREVKTKKGDRMAILMISDSSGQNEIALFPETYRQYEDMIVMEKPFLMTLALNADGERVRINMESMGYLDDALKKDALLKVRVQDTDALESFEELFKAQDKGTTRIQMTYPVKDLGDVVIDLGGVNMTKRYQHQLDALAGIDLH